MRSQICDNREVGGLVCSLCLLTTGLVELTQVGVSRIEIREFITRVNTLQIKPCDFNPTKTFVDAVLNLGVACERKAGREKVRLGLPRLQPEKNTFIKRNKRLFVIVA